MESLMQAQTWGEKCGQNFNQNNVFVKAYSSSVYAEVPDRRKVAKKDQSKAFGKWVKNRQIKPKLQNPNLKGITWQYCGRVWHVKAKCKGKNLVPYGLMQWAPTCYVLLSTYIAYG